MSAGYRTEYEYDGSRRAYSYDAGAYRNDDQGPYDFDNDGAAYSYDYRTELSYDGIGWVTRTKYPAVDYVDDSGAPQNGNLYSHVGM